METRKIGSLDGLGGRAGLQQLRRAHRRRRAPRAVVDAALDAGINFFDTADIYGGTQERGVPRPGARRPARAGGPRHQVRHEDGRRSARAPSPRTCARRRRGQPAPAATDRIDLYQLHQPDPETPIADTLGALDELVRAGKVREIGCSNFSAAQLREAEAAGRPAAARFVSVQNEYSLLHREPEAERARRVRARRASRFLPYFPLPSGLLTGKYRQGEPAPEGTRLAESERPRALPQRAQRCDMVEALIAFAEARGHTILELAFAWLLGRPGRRLGDRRRDQARAGHANAGAIAWKLIGGSITSSHSATNCASTPSASSSSSTTCCRSYRRSKTC